MKKIFFLMLMLSIVALSQGMNLTDLTRIARGEKVEIPQSFLTPENMNRLHTLVVKGKIMQVTPLIAAIIGGNQFLTYRILSMDGIDINKQIPDLLGNALMFAVGYEREDVIENLIKRTDIDLNLLDHENHTALDIAIEQNNPSRQEILRKVGAKTGEELEAEKQIKIKKIDKPIECKFPAITSEPQSPNIATNLPSNLEKLLMQAKNALEQLQKKLH